MSLPKGVTYRVMARKFQQGWSIEDVAYYYNCFVRDVEHAIRTMLRRQR